MVRNLIALMVHYRNSSPTASIQGRRLIITPAVRATTISICRVLFKSSMMTISNQSNSLTKASRCPLFKCGLLRKLSSQLHSEKNWILCVTRRNLVNLWSHPTRPVMKYTKTKILTRIWKWKNDPGPRGPTLKMVITKLHLIRIVITKMIMFKSKK